MFRRLQSVPWIKALVSPDAFGGNAAVVTTIVMAICFLAVLSQVMGLKSVVSFYSQRQGWQASASQRAAEEAEHQKLVEGRSIEITKTRGTLSQLGSELETRRADVERLNTETATLRKEVEQLRATRDQLVQESDRAKRQTESAASALVDLNAELAAAQDRRKTIENAINKSRIDQDAADVAARTGEQDLQKKRTELEGIKRQSADAQTRLDGILADLRAMQSRLTDASSEAAALSRAKQQSQLQEQQAKEAVADAAKTLATTREQHAIELKRLEEMRAELSQHRADLATLDRAVEDRRKELDSVNGTIAERRATIGTLDTLIERLRKTSEAGGLPDLSIISRETQSGPMSTTQPATTQPQSR